MKTHFSWLPEIARVLVHLDHVARFNQNGSREVIPTGERSGLQTHIAATESVSSCVPMKY
jgi:hypothetical protein